jgi:hypothetical protein
VPPLYRDTGYALYHLLEDIKRGRVGLPDIQRPFVWSSAKARDLFDSLYRGYPVGTLMLWETGAEAGTRRIGANGDGERTPQLLIVDGQQRLTSLYAVVTGHPVMTKDFVEKRIRIAFRPSDETFEVTDAAIERDPEFIADITALWEDGYPTTLRRFLAGVRQAREEEVAVEEEDRLGDRVNRVHDLRDFRFQVIELSAEANEEEVAEIFVRINSEGVQLNQADFILTLMSVHWDAGRAQIEAFCRAAVDPAVKGPSPRNPFIAPSPDQLLRVAVALGFQRGRLQYVYNILRGKDLETGTVSAERREQQFATLAAAQEQVLDLTNWHEFLKCVQAAGFRSRKMITSDNALLFSYALWLIGRRDFGLDYRELRGAIARWFFMAHTTGRYSSSPESQLESDLGRISALPPGDGTAFVEALDRIVAANFTNDYWEITLPNRLDTSSPRSPALFAYLAALNLLDAEVLLSDVRIRDLLDPAHLAPRAVERHHLFPKAHLASLGISGTRQVNAIGNMAYLDWPENAHIGATAPADYWPQLSAALPPERLVRQAHWHALPVGWEQLDYETFVERRRPLIAAVVREGFATLLAEGGPDRRISLADLVAAGESQTLELKSTARWNVRSGQHDARLEHVIVKAVCGFLNAEGGTLAIGVDDDGRVLGLAQDLATLGSKPDHDGYELFLRQLLDANLSAPTAATVRIRFEQLDGASVCVVAVAAAGRPVFAKAPKGDGAGLEFWVRVGNATKQLHGDDMVEYQQDHWG